MIQLKRFEIASTQFSNTDFKRKKVIGTCETAEISLTKRNACNFI